MDLPYEGKMFFFLGASSLLKAVSLTLMGSSSWSRRVKHRVGRVAGLRLYPLKSGRPVHVPRLTCEHSGVHSDQDVWDRSWMVTTSDYTFVTARTEPSLVLVQPSLHGSHVHLDAANMRTLKLPVFVSGDSAGKAAFTKVHGQPVQGVDCGEEASAWISDYLGRPGHRLLYSPQWMQKRFVNNGPSKWHKKAEDKDMVAFQDMSPCSLMSEPSLEDLAGKVAVPISELTFRCNIIMSDCEPYDEDHCVEFHVGTTVLQRLKHTDRCILTNVDPATGTKNPNEEPVRSMRQTRMIPGFPTPCFCISLSVAQEGSINVGDEIYAMSG